MVKLNADMKAGTDAATVTDVQVNHVSQTIAKPIVVGSLIRVTTGYFESDKAFSLKTKVTDGYLTEYDEVSKYCNWIDLSGRSQPSVNINCIEVV